ncbi:hypothetical protein J3R30DRAFT_3756171 [Lentinula aciculospora]|uniref:Uncharacterized protein n=1 Tax=Lentinula aciculospora TaxID=153920 RepID=A0A9W9DMI4_9AGAR|nr:hypothetical protein J3R30DRAFT_3756171 [Lentinula aciculospora]
MYIAASHATFQVQWILLLLYVVSTVSLPLAPLIFIVEPSYSITPSAASSNLSATTVSKAELSPGLSTTTPLKLANSVASVHSFLSRHLLVRTSSPEAKVTFIKGQSSSNVPSDYQWLVEWRIEDMLNVKLQSLDSTEKIHIKKVDGVATHPSCSFNILLSNWPKGKILGKTIFGGTSMKGWLKLREKGPYLDAKGALQDKKGDLMFYEYKPSDQELKGTQSGGSLSTIEE